jgi:hypothetical protein
VRYEFQGNGIDAVDVPLQMTLYLSSADGDSYLTARIEEPIIGLLPNGSVPTSIAEKFPLLLTTGPTSDGQFAGELFSPSQYLFEWQVTAEGNPLRINGSVFWAGGRYELTTFANEEFVATEIGAGDANLDRQFDSEDLVQVLAAGQYEDSLPDNSHWASGDWNADGEFDSGDLVLALQTGSYEFQVPATSVSAVPELASPVMLLMGWSAIAMLPSARRFTIRSIR